MKIDKVFIKFGKKIGKGALDKVESENLVTLICRLLILESVKMKPMRPITRASV